VNRRHLLRTGLQAGALAAAPLLGLAGDQRYYTPDDPTRFELSPPPPKTILGVHTRLTDEVEPWKISETLDLVRAMGAGWIVELFPWAYIEPRRGEEDWAHPDLVVREANRQGLEIIARLDFVPDWARPKGSTPRFLPETSWADYASFVGRFARRYREAVQYFVIWNEPNTTFELGFQPVDPGAYVQLLDLAGRAIRDANPKAIVMPAGLAPTLDRSDLALDDVLYLQALYDHGARGLFDALAVHSYGWKFPPDSDAKPDRLNFARAELLRDVMVKNGDAGKPIIITESGWNDSPRWTKAVHPGQRIQYTLRALDKVKTDWPWTQAMCIWAFRLPAPAHDYNDYFTLVDTTFRLKPIYDQLQARSASWLR
jgi:hypothetical protein